MLKSKAIELLGGSPHTAAAALGCTYQAVIKWPDTLTVRISDRVIGAVLRRGGKVPPELVGKKARAKATA